MDAPELKLKCLELAMIQAKMQGEHADIERVAEIHDRFYALVTDSPEKVSEPQPEKIEAPKPEPKNLKPRDKTPEIFK